MAKGLEDFIRERVAVYDRNTDASRGSPFDNEVIQPILRRLGPDPFTLDALTYAQTRIAQEHPDMATHEGSRLRDLVLKSFVLLMDPIIRENRRIDRGQSFRDPSTLTLDEATALGANIFAEPDRGGVSRGRVRLYYNSPQQQSVNQANVCFAKNGLRFEPTEVQSIRTEEMIFNQEGKLYYFDISVVASAPGAQYNIEPGEICSIANVAAAVRVTNKSRFRFGEAAETASAFIDRTKQSLTERSLVAERGIVAVLTEAFPELHRLAVVGKGDPEMQRDVLSGGSLGEPLASGLLASALDDGEGAPLTRRVLFSATEVDFVELFGGAVSSPDGYVLTLYDAFPPGELPRVRDLKVLSVLGPQMLELEDQVLYRLATSKAWTLRRRELLLSKIPGGIIFPNGPNGTIRTPVGSVHIGGCFDIYASSTALDPTSLVLEAVTDDSPIAAGHEATISSGLVTLTDLVLGTTYAQGDAVWNALNTAAEEALSLELAGNVASDGTYRIISVTGLDTIGDSPILSLSPTPANAPGQLRWRLFDTIDIDLVEPKNTRLEASDLATVAGSAIVTSGDGIDFNALGVSEDDVFRILAGDDAGDYEVQDVAPFVNTVTLDRPVTQNGADLAYVIFRRNTGGGVRRPLVRVTSVELLDTSGQPVGSKIPYARAVEARSKSFANIAQGLKLEKTDGVLGIVGPPITTPVTTIDGQPIRIKHGIVGEDFDSITDGVLTTVVFAGVSLLAPAIVDQINAGFVGAGYGPVAVVVDGNRVGILPLSGSSCVFYVGDWFGGVYSNVPAVLLALFGNNTYYGTTRDVRSASVSALTDKWLSSTISPPVDTIDVLQVLDGYQPGVFDNPTVDSRESNGVLLVAQNMNPAVGRHFQLGSRSLGAARVYFLEPTTVEFDATTRLAATLDDRSEVVFKLDPTVQSVRIPPPPATASPKDGALTSAGSTLTSSSSDFVASNIRVGDKVVMTYTPIIGSVVLAEEVALMALRTLVLSLAGGVDKTITFVRDATTIASTSLTRSGIATQINTALGRSIASINSLTNKLELEGDLSIIVRDTGTANSLLGIAVSADASNASLFDGEYDITAIAQHVLTLDVTWGSTATRQHFQVVRPGTQRVGSTQMSTQVGDGGLYYVDLELVSVGCGNRFNLTSDVSMVLTGYKADGYHLTSDDDDLTFSGAEPLRLHLSRTFIEVGSSDDVQNARQISGQNVQVAYDMSTLCASLQSFVSAETERVVAADPLVRHLIPHFIRADIRYAGGSLENTVLGDIEDHISKLFPNDAFEVSAINNIAKRRGATSIDNPITLLGIVHGVDRTVRVERTQNRLTTGRLAAFLPDVLNVTRRTG